MDLLEGIRSVLTTGNLTYCFVGVLLGTLVGVLPGLGPAATIAMLLPLTMYLDPIGSTIMLAGIYYGAMYGGSTTSILVNIPGEPSSIATCIEGFKMTQRGKAGEALWIAAVGSFIAGTFGALMISFVGPGIAKYALFFGPPEKLGLLIFCMTTIMSLAGSSVLKGVISALIGFFIAAVGVDPLTGTPRFDFGSIAMSRGLDIIPVMVGVFGIGEIFSSAEEGAARIYEGKLGKMVPRGKDLKVGLLASVRGSLIGFFMGLLPGIGPTLTSFLSYDMEKRISKHPEKFGTGVIEGVAGPEASNNATAMAGFIPMLGLGIPSTPAFAVIMAALIIYGVQPGPMIFIVHKDFIWAVIGSMYIGNIILLVLNLPLVGLWARISLIPYKFLGPLILGLCLIAAYTARNAMFDVWVSFTFGILGYLMRKRAWPLPPLVLGFVLGDLFESNLRQSLSMSGGSLSVFYGRPIVVAFLVMTTLAVVVMSGMLKRRVPTEVLERTEPH